VPEGRPTRVPVSQSQLRPLIGQTLSSLIVNAEQPQEVTAADKKAVFKTMETLPKKGEFFTEERIDKAAPHTRVLFALTKKDIDEYAKSLGLETYSLYPFHALSRGLLDRKDQRDCGVKNFNKIAHPDIKVFWGVVLFDKKAAQRK
jgi:hypothetical protein